MTSPRTAPRRHGRSAHPTIAVVDYGAGNLVSIEQALLAVGAEVMIVSDPAALVTADGLVVPGVGASAPAMNRLRRRGLVDPIIEWARTGRPLLGICLGLQLLFDGSDEDGAATFGLIPGRVVRLERAPRLPHIGWNQVSPRRQHPLLAGVAPGADFYFVHSYVGVPRDERVIVADTEHGSAFASVVAAGGVVGVQFHPERSGPAGLRVLANFRAMVGTGARRAVA